MNDTLAKSSILMKLLCLNKKAEIQQSGLLNTTLASNFYSVDGLVVITLIGIMLKYWTKKMTCAEEN